MDNTTTRNAIRNCTDVDCTKCPERDNCDWMDSDYRTFRKRNGWVRVRNGEEVR